MTLTSIKSTAAACVGIASFPRSPGGECLKLNTAKNSKCDVIVMASHGRRGISALLLGSETQKVLTHSKLPVIVVL